MFHANAWGIPYAAAMLGTKLVFPGPHLHPDDLLPLLESEKVTVSCGVPTIWLGMVQILEKNPRQDGSSSRDCDSPWAGPPYRNR